MEAVTSILMPEMQTVTSRRKKLLDGVPAGQSEQPPRLRRITFHPNSSQLREARVWFHGGLILLCRRIEQSLSILVCHLSLFRLVQCVRCVDGRRQVTCGGDVTWRHPIARLRNLAVCQVCPCSSVRWAALKQDIAPATFDVTKKHPPHEFGYCGESGGTMVSVLFWSDRRMYCWGWKKWPGRAPMQHVI
jgi:hypothetical protein